ncbi:MAG: DUF721 domain-containing protein [Armatimonas sp.]
MPARRGGSFDPVGDVLGRQLGSLNIARKIKEHTAPLVWAEVVGEQIAGATQVLGVEGGVLRVSTKSAVWAHELTYYKKDLLRRLNRRLETSESEPIIMDIHFQNRGVRTDSGEPEPEKGPSIETLESVELSPAELRAIEEGIAGVRDERLRARLRITRLRDARLKTWRLDNGWVPCLRCEELLPPLPDGEATSCARCRMLGG